MKWCEWILAGALILLAIQDLKEHKVWIWGTFPAGCIQTGILLYQKAYLTAGEHILGMLSAAGGLAILRTLLGERFGSGDIWVLAGICLTCGITMTAAVLLIGLLMSAVVSAILLAAGKVRLSTGIPFVPFLAAAYGICMLL